MRKEFYMKNKTLHDIYVVNCGYEDCCLYFNCAAHKRQYYLLHYVTKGEGYYEVNDLKFKVSAGDMFLIRPDELVTYYSPEPENTWSFCWIGFNGKAADVYAEECGLIKGKYIYSLHSNTFYSVISNCLEYLGNVQGEPSQLCLNSYLLQVLSEIEKKCKRGPAKTTSNDLVERAVRYIEYNYMNKIFTSQIAEFLSIDRSHFYRIFKKATGSAPEHYLMCYRIQKAKDFLKNSKYSITEIATFVGVPDVYYFSKMFKKIVGVSPTKYRNL